MSDSGKMYLENGVGTKGEVHWIITYNEDDDTHSVECPTIELNIDDETMAVSRSDWQMSTLHTGTLMDCAMFIRSIALFDDPNYDPFGEDDETRQEDEAEG